jgi:CRP/FNR family cyclic AMP-dependent transcriptional regulator
MAGDILSREVKDGGIVFSQGDTADGMYVVLDGKVRVYTTTNGHQTTLGMIGRGGFFGEMALFDHKPRSASVAAVGVARLRFISVGEFAKMRMSDPFAREMLLKMSERLRAADQELSKLESQSTSRHAYLSTMNAHRDWAV